MTSESSVKEDAKGYFGGFVFLLWWHVWAHRNACVFRVMRLRENVFFYNFVLTSLFGLVVDVVISSLVGSGGFKTRLLSLLVCNCLGF